MAYCMAYCAEIVISFHYGVHNSGFLCKFAKILILTQ